MADSPTLTRIRRGFAAVDRAHREGATERQVASANDAADRAVTMTIPATLAECVRYVDLIVANDRDFLDAVPLKGLENLRAGLAGLAA